MPSKVAASPRPRTPGGSLYWLYLVALAVCLVGNLVIRQGTEAGWLQSGGRSVLAVVTALPLAVAAVQFWRLLRRELDEMLQRIVLEGMAFALVVWIPLAALYMNLRAAGIWTPRLDAPDVVLVPALLVAVGIAVARRRFE